MPVELPRLSAALLDIMVSAKRRHLLYLCLDQLRDNVEMRGLVRPDLKCTADEIDRLTVLGTEVLGRSASSVSGAKIILRGCEDFFILNRLVFSSFVQEL